jgi:uncharacterized protein
MKLFIISILISLNGIAQLSYSDSLTKERVDWQKELFETSRFLTDEEKSNLERLDYFPIDQEWIIPVTFSRDRGKPFQMETTTSRKANYRKEGTLTFSMDGKEYQLTIFKNLDLTDPKYKNYYFLPFKDATSPKETYGGGRFIEIYQDFSKREVHFLLDFNTAFNPYCAYSPRFSCPITPPENFIDVRIEAGEKNVVKKTETD